MSNDSLNSLFLSPPRPKMIAHATHGLGGVVTESFLLPDLWMLHFYEYSGRIEVNGQEFALVPGSASLTPPNARIVFHYEGRSPHLYAHFSLPSGNSSTPFFWNPDPRIPPLRALLDGALSFQKTSPQRVTARLWDVLLGLAALIERPSPHSRSQEKLDECLNLLSDHSASLTLSQIARKVSLHPNQLTQLFRRELGTTPVRYRRELKLERARLLLKHSDLPVKAIACTIGIPDLQAFNKMFRQSEGISPRSYRETHHQP